MFSRGREEEEANLFVMRQAICFETAQQCGAIKAQVAEIVLARALLRCAAGMKYRARLRVRKACERGVFECARGDRRNFVPVCKLRRVAAGVSAIALINGVVLKLVGEELKREVAKGLVDELIKLCVADETLNFCMKQMKTSLLFSRHFCALQKEFRRGDG